MSKVTIKIPRELYHRLGQMVEGTGFSSITEFITFVLRTLAASEEVKHDGLTAEEVRRVKRMLDRLGYLKEDE
jgi:Arc/MetJ-type ribon-helix-helix transcriptional regulator